MMPSLLIGDFILVNKFAYGLRLPITTRSSSHRRAQARRRGGLPPAAPPDQDWIKRVIGLPGDTVAYRDNTVFVNGVALKYQQIGQYDGKGQGADMTGADLRQEDLPGRPHPVLEREDSPFSIQGEGEWVVPPDTISSWATIVIIARTAVSGPCTSCRRKTPRQGIPDLVQLGQAGGRGGFLEDRLEHPVIRRTTRGEGDNMKRTQGGMTLLGSS
jgi:signal peptidase I